VNSQAHKSRLATLSNTSLFFRRQLWIWPLIAAALLGLVALYARSSIETALRQSLTDQLDAVLQTDKTALEFWLAEQKSIVTGIARDPDLVKMVEVLVRDAQGVPHDQLRDQLAQPLAEMRTEMRGYVDAHGYLGFMIIDPEKIILASSYDELIGVEMAFGYRSVFEKALAGSAGITEPFSSTIPLPDSRGGFRSGVPTMVAGAPIRDSSGKAIAVLGLRIRPEGDFSRILMVARTGNSGETYACNDKGVLLSESRFDDQLKHIGLLADRPDERSILNIEIRNPGVDMTTDDRPALSRSEQPFTFAAAEVIAGHTGSNVVGYRDYRGVPSVGAWTWLPNFGFGIITEMDLAQATAPFAIVRRVFWGLLTLLVLASIVIFIYTVLMARLQRVARHSAMELRRLGQYILHERIGSGGMGAVYRAHHAMLRRPTAIKLIDPDKTTDATISRFEREVQLTSQLNHPNTIAIYDYGRTPDGVFYYAMELLDGLTLQALIERYGPQPEQRVVNILKQVCGSLIEAHGAGLIHRDIKPANIMINRRGGMFDFVKLLDFGLVKAVDGQRQSTLTAAPGLTGTPLYMSPEAIERAWTVDARSDLYALGAVGYFLLTGTPVFQGENIIEICMRHVDTAATAPSVRLGRPISPDLDALILRCLAKSPADRPQSAKELEHLLERANVTGTWTEEDGEVWWRSVMSVAMATTAELPTQHGRDTATLGTN
jgi:eukaryotic-like serine/threonine-protein kinase